MDLNCRHEPFGAGERRKGVPKFVLPFGEAARHWASANEYNLVPKEIVWDRCGVQGIAIAQVGESEWLAIILNPTRLARVGGL
jgi:hypothetical protein